MKFDVEHLLRFVHISREFEEAVKLKGEKNSTKDGFIGLYTD